MEAPQHSINALFEQLGLASDDNAIDQFIEAQSPLPARTPLADGPMWNPSQSAFLREAIAEDADWAEVVDQLDAQLRASPG
jgi:hypothetical protein